MLFNDKNKNIRKNFERSKCVRDGVETFRRDCQRLRSDIFNNVMAFFNKRYEDLNLYPNLSVAFEMLITRLCHLKNMPDPQEVINSMKKFKTNDLNLGNSDDLITEPKTQIKNISQELEKPKPNLNDNKITSKINSLDDLINVAEREKEIELKFDLERNVRLVKFSNGKIDIAFNERLSKDFIKKLSSKLLEWTGHRWIITLSKDIGDQTIYEKKMK